MTQHDWTWLNSLETTFDCSFWGSRGPFQIFLRFSSKSDLRASNFRKSWAKACRVRDWKWSGNMIHQSNRFKLFIHVYPVSLWIKNFYTCLYRLSRLSEVFLVHSGRRWYKRQLYDALCCLWRKANWRRSPRMIREDLISPRNQSLRSWQET